MNQQLSWPALSYQEFKPTAYLLHLSLQILGKLRLATAFEAEWANVILLVSATGLSTGMIPYKNGAFNVDFNFIDQQIICSNSHGQTSSFQMTAMSVAQFYELLFKNLHDIDVNLVIDTNPIEIPHSIKFEQDTKPYPYETKLVKAWWQILLNSQLIMQRYHSRFMGKTQPIGLMWGHLDLRDVRYNGQRVTPTGANTNYILRNSMDEAQIMCGWWHGNDVYPKPAYYSYTYPQPTSIEQAKILPSAARWEKILSEFILDYDDLRNAKNPEADLLAFLESTYQAGAKLANWDTKLLGSGNPV